MNETNALSPLSKTGNYIKFTFQQAYLKNAKGHQIETRPKHFKKTSINNHFLIVITNYLNMNKGDIKTKQIFKEVVKVFLLIIYTMKNTIT